jgi:serine/threonine-protein kinase
MMHCPSSDRLQQLLADRLAGADAEAVEAHVETCSSCQQALEKLTGDADSRNQKQADPPDDDSRPLSDPLRREGVVEAPGGDFLRRLEKQPPAGAWPSPGPENAAKIPNRPAAPLAKPLSPEGTTIDVHNGAPEERIKVRLVPESSRPHLTTEIQALLRKRLLVIYTICAAAVGGLFVLGCVAEAVVWSVLPDFAATNIWYPESVEIGALIALGFNWFWVGTWVVLAAILRSRRRLSLRQLRVMELIGFGGLALYNAGFTFAGFHSNVLVGHVSPDAQGMIEAACTVSILWFSLMVIYGMYIPNTWCRCAAVVGAMALTPIAIGAAAWSFGRGPESGLQVIFWGELGWWMAFGAAIAIYGSHKISLLRQEAFEARKLGQYRLKQRLGAGGMGEVYLAEHALLRRPCAIKLIRPERAGDPSTLRRFEREVQATAALTHPNTVEIFDYGHAADGTFYYVMEYLPGLSLENVVERHGPLPPERAVHLLRQVCGALQEAHAIGLIHRDVKPGNVLVCERGGRHDVVKLLDFGLVRIAAESGREAGDVKLTQEGAITGTPAYMSPEQAAGKADLDGRSDLYSLGAVAYFLLTGRPPFVRKTAVQTLAAHLSEAVVAPGRCRPEVPADLNAVVLRCLEKDPARRFPDAESLDRDLARCGCTGQWSRERAGDWWRGRLETAPAGADRPTV